MLEGVQVSADADQWSWFPDSNGEFTVKSVKKLLLEEAGLRNDSVMEWCKWLPAKVNIHVWRSMSESIPTGEAHKKRNVLVGDSSCLLCNSADETAEHLFTACFTAATVWNGITSWCKISNIIAFSVKDLGIHNEIVGSERKKEAVKGIISIACWSIWRARNNVKFYNVPARIENILSEVKALGFLWFSNRSKHRGVEW
ncbi:uncharacterized protein LOC110933968 [Helianthus annuus]|uniref:uncharacterized protein LOC110933968 n=1 Tax=Helianthus annuus TaxID=4232 RepID=UPI000B8FDAC1|nr:uncharacterized protein LOC110933968 [Helianthus annuus]